MPIIIIISLIIISIMECLFIPHSFLYLKVMHPYFKMKMNRPTIDINKLCSRLWMCIVIHFKHCSFWLAIQRETCFLPLSGVPCVQLFLRLQHGTSAAVIPWWCVVHSTSRIITFEKYFQGTRKGSVSASDVMATLCVFRHWSDYVRLGMSWKYILDYIFYFYFFI